MRRLSPVRVEPPMPRWWERFIGAVSLLAVMVLAAEEMVEQTFAWVAIADLCVCALLLGDFLYRFARTQRPRWRFVKRNWVELLAAVPVPVHGARHLRILRAIRLLVLARRVARHYDLPLATTRTIVSVLGVASATWLGAAGLFYWAEAEVNPQVEGVGDALWWAMTTLSTVGYGDLYPSTTGGRVVAILTMVMGIGVLGTLAGTIASGVAAFRDRLRRGLGQFRMNDHLLILGWNEKAFAAIDDFRHDPRHTERRIAVLAPLDEAPIAEGIGFVAGQPGHRQSLERASAANAAIALVFADDPGDARSDHTTALTVMVFRRLNPKAVVAAELVSADNRELLEEAGCDAIVDGTTLAAQLLVRSVQDRGAAAVVDEMLSNTVGETELYRVAVSVPGESWTELVGRAVRQQITVVGLIRDGKHDLHPPPELRLQEGDEVFVLAEQPPEFL